MFLKLAACDWIRERRHCLLTGHARPNSGGAVVLSGHVPALAVDIALTSSPGTITLAGQAPVVVSGLALAAISGSITVTGISR